MKSILFNKKVNVKKSKDSFLKINEERRKFTKMTSLSLLATIVPPLNATAAKYVFVDQDECTGCEACIPECEVDAIFINSNGRAEIDQSRCDLLVDCYWVCPVEAIIRVM